jgi:hypothetical protein
MADTNGVFSVEMLGSSRGNAAALSGWAVVLHEASFPRRIIGVYLTSAQAETAAERLRLEART